VIPVNTFVILKKTLPKFVMNNQEAANKAQQVFNSAADYFDHPALSFWQRFGLRTIELVGLQPGDRVLDVCCGTGASALPAALQVSASGTVLGVDLAESLLALGRQKASQQDLSNVEFRLGDFTNLKLPSESFDAIICVFGIFFVPDMEGAIQELLRMVKPGGKLAITSWGQQVFEPANQFFWETIQAERPELYKEYTPWYRINTAATLQSLLEVSGIHSVQVFAQTDRHPLARPEDWWTMVLGGGLRGTIDQLNEATRERVKASNIASLKTNNVEALESEVLYAIAQKDLVGS
jgi:ubiquinone/menaquinone biosynthesis C-methylase UbiE